MQLSTIAIIQARMSSSRLPGKVLLDLGGQPMLARVVERARRAKLVNDVVVATTTDLSDDPIEALCAESGYPCSRGSLHDVLDRYYQAARTFGADVIVRITADCPVIDPDVVDRTIEAFQLPVSSNQSSVISGPITDHARTTFEHSLITNNCSLVTDYCANRLPPPWGRTFPIGLDAEVCSFAALELAWKEADQPFHREHVMPYFYEGIPAEALQPLAGGDVPAVVRTDVLLGGRDVPPERLYIRTAISPRGFRVVQLHHHPDYGPHRWTVDTPADLDLLRQIYAHFSGRDDFSWLEVLALFKSDPSLAEINAGVQHKTAFDVDARRKT